MTQSQRRELKRQLEHVRHTQVIPKNVRRMIGRLCFELWCEGRHWSRLPVIYRKKSIAAKHRIRH